jgi:hypothetical protein
MKNSSGEGYFSYHHETAIRAAAARSFENRLSHNLTAAKQIDKSASDDSKKPQERHKKTRISKAFVTAGITATKPYFNCIKEYRFFSPGYFTQKNLICFSLRGPPSFV